MFKNTIYIIDINGVIVDNVANNFYNDIAEVKRKATQNDALLIRVNSPGGQPSLSLNMHDVIKNIDFINTYLYIDSIGASGGYLLASAAKRIYANPFAIVGSIGVILQKIEVSKLADKIGVSEDNIHIGTFKQPLSIFKPTNTDSATYIKTQLMEPTYKFFVEFVAKARGISLDDMEPYVDGKIFIANEVNNKLVDELITYQILVNRLCNEYNANVKKVNTVKKTFLEKIGFKTKLSLSLNNNDNFAINLI